MEHEETYQYMMEALDGELSEDGRYRLEVHLRACPDCAREWQAMQAIDLLFRGSPMLVPAAEFTQRTLARLPNRAYRLWLIGALYLLMLASGLLPVVGGIWLVGIFRSILDQPALLRGLVQSGMQVLAILETLVKASGQILGSLGQLAGEHPAVVGSFLLMLGIISVWTGVYSQVMGGGFSGQTMANR